MLHGGSGEWWGRRAGGARGCCEPGSDGATGRDGKLELQVSVESGAATCRRQVRAAKLLTIICRNSGIIEQGKNISIELRYQEIK